MKKILSQINRVYYFNFAVVGTLIFSILAMFLVQFKVESLQNNIAKTENEILFFKNKIEALELEWVYLTRPQRVRQLSSKYLDNNHYVEVSQVKNFNRLEGYYLANYNKANPNEFAMK
jgi:hypothetical protein